MTALSVICISFVLIALIVCVSDVVKTTSYNKWKAKNPDAFKDGFWEDGGEE